MPNQLQTDDFVQIFNNIGTFVELNQTIINNDSRIFNLMIMSDNGIDEKLIKSNFYNLIKSKYPHQNYNIHSITSCRYAKYDWEHSNSELFNINLHITNNIKSIKTLTNLNISINKLQQIIGLSKKQYSTMFIQPMNNGYNVIMYGVLSISDDLINSIYQKLKNSYLCFYSIGYYVKVFKNKLGNIQIILTDKLSCKKHITTNIIKTVLELPNSNVGKIYIKRLTESTAITCCDVKVSELQLSGIENRLTAFFAPKLCTVKFLSLLSAKNGSKYQLTIYIENTLDDSANNQSITDAYESLYNENLTIIDNARKRKDVHNALVAVLYNKIRESRLDFDYVAEDLGLRTSNLISILKYSDINDNIADRISTYLFK